MTYHFKKIDSIIDFKKRKDQLGILERKVPTEARNFFENFTNPLFNSTITMALKSYFYEFTSTKKNLLIKT